VNLNEYEELARPVPPSAPVSISVDELEGLREGTLLYGYTCDRDSFHVYLTDGLLHRFVYSYDGTRTSYVAGTSLPARDIVPNKRVYPEPTSVELVRLLWARGVDVPLTRYSDERAALAMGHAWHGKVK
jgi:hypothetical protein